jgi:hypothetical protein
MRINCLQLCVAVAWHLSNKSYGNVPVCASLVYKVKDLKAMKELRELSEANELNELFKDEMWDLNRE